jgi:predicted NAD/FAD-dependent oxidoreductase
MDFEIRVTMEDGTELRFDHGAPYFTVTNDEVARLVSGWEARGIVAEWKATFACFDLATGKFTDFDKVQFRSSCKKKLNYSGNLFTHHENLTPN